MLIISPVMRLFLLLALGLSAVAFAGSKQLSLPVGHSTTVSMGSSISKVTVANPNVLEAKRDGRRVTFVARAAGTTEATVRTADGELHFKIYVAADKYGLPY